MKNKTHKKSGFTPTPIRKLMSGFTLIEVLVAVLIFVILFVIAFSFVNLASGSTKSNRTKRLTSNMRNALDAISLKLANANQKSDNLALSPVIYGFRINGQILGMALPDNSGGVECVFLGKFTLTKSLSMKYVPDCAAWPTNSALDQPMTTEEDIVIDSFNLSGNNFDPNNPTVAPYLKIEITGHDPDPEFASNVITLQ